MIFRQQRNPVLLPIPIWDSEYEYSTAGTSPVDGSSPLVEEDEEDITSFPRRRRRRERGPRPWHKRTQRFLIFAWREFLEFMNMPLWAMLVAILIALFPALQHYLFFQKNGFIRGSVIYAIQTCGDVSIPLILVILGANIANDDHSALEASQTDSEADRKWSLTPRQRGIILGVSTRVIIVPVYPFLGKYLIIVDYMSVDHPCCIMGCTISYGSFM